jgi:hypothetical protein
MGKAKVKVAKVVKCPTSPTKEYFAIKKGVNLSDFSLIQKTSSLHNLCWFYALYNALRCAKERMAFSDGCIQSPAFGAMNFFHSDANYREHGGYARIFADGANGEDIGRYLQFLKQKNTISGFVWINVTERSQNYANFFNTTEKLKYYMNKHNTRCFFISGVSFTLLQRAKFQKSMKSSSKIETDKNEAHRIQMDTYRKMLIHQGTSKCNHGCAVIFQEDGSMTIFDSGLNKIKEGASPTDLIASVGICFRIFAFKIKI